MLVAAEGSLLVTFRDMVDRLLDLPGSTYSCVAGMEHGEIVAEAGEVILEPAIVLRWGMEAAVVLDRSPGGGMEDFILISGGHYHLVRPLGDARSLLVYLCAERASVNLALARRELAAARPETAAPQLPNLPPIGPLSRRLPAASRTAAAMAPVSRPSAERLPVRDTVEVPLPRRAAAAAVPAAGAPPSRWPPIAPVLGQDWADDISTMNRLLVALRALRSRAESE